MTILLALLICFFLLFEGIKLYNNIFNPMAIMGLIWAIEVFAYYINSSSFYPLSDTTQFVVVVGLFSFGCACLLYQVVRRGKAPINVSRNLYRYELNTRNVYFLAVISLALVLPEAIASYEILQSGANLSDIRGIYSRGEVSIVYSFSPLLGVVTNYICKPFMLLMYPICAIDLVIGKRRIFLILLTIGITIINIIYQGGRLPILLLGLHFIIIASIFKERIHFSHKTKLFILLLFVGSIVLVDFVTSQRGDSGMSETLNDYTSRCIPLLNHYIPIADRGVVGYGFASTCGFFNSFFTILENLGLPFPSFMKEVISALDVEEGVSIGNSAEMNAYVTLFHSFYIDGRILGVIIWMFIYGWIGSISYAKAYFGKSPYGVLFYAIICQSMVFSMIRFQFQTGPYALCLLLIPLCFKRIK